MALEVRNRKPLPKAETQKFENYALNIDKLLRNKLEAAQRAHVVSYELSEGNIVFSTDAVLFELIDIALSQYFNKLSEQNCNVKVTDAFDNTGVNRTKRVYRVIKADGVRYTLNIYVTTSRFLLNGKNCMEFLEEDMPNINAIVDFLCVSNNIDLKVFNDLLVEKLTEFLSKQSTNALSAAGAAITINNCREDSDKCPGCNRACKTNSVLCTKGSHWIHYHCQKLKKDEIEQLASSHDESFCCRFCKTSDTSTPSKTLNECEQTGVSLDEQTSLKTYCVASHIDKKNQPKLMSKSKSDSNLRLQIPKVTKATESTVALDILHDEMDSGQLQESEIITTVSAASVESRKSSNDTSRQKLVQSVEVSSAECSCLTKLSDIRERELKVKKKEEEVKILQLKNQEKLKDLNKLESYCKRLEARNEELQITLQTVAKRLERLEAGECVNDKRHDADPIPNESSREKVQTGFNSTIQARLTKLQDRLTNFVFDKIENELEQFIFKDNFLHDTECENIPVRHNKSHIVSSNRVLEAASDIGVHTAGVSVCAKPVLTNIHSVPPVTLSTTSVVSTAAARVCATPDLTIISSVPPVTRSSTSVVSTAAASVCATPDLMIISSVPPVTRSTTSVVSTAASVCDMPDITNITSVPPVTRSTTRVVSTAAASVCAAPVLTNINSCPPVTLSTTSVVSTAMHYSDRVESVPNRNSIDSDSERVSVVPGHVHGQPLMYLPAGTSVRSFPDQHPFLYHVKHRNIPR
ncbi:hypothetical protein DPMN_002505 [Dreissena polymorpha]|uniref:Zinc finger PHD-type domain-containing protein n=1 Tax=Dreissena polymorpha TaxID=45954 RepID=A0A9D4RTY9_DREPO|nr:hypothetical protein DPMN_002505 [Dreissena polymorpha]